MEENTVKIMDEPLLVDEVLQAEEKNEVEETKRFYEYKGRSYNLRYNMRRLQMAEQSTKSSVMETLTAHNSMMTIQELMIYFALGLCDTEGNYIKPGKGLELAEKCIEKEGYLNLNMQVVDAIQRDCGFLFQSA